jgi:hypothetical protein
MWRGKDSIGKFSDAFLSMAGFDWDAKFPWSPNVVPDVDAMLQDVADDHIFRVRLKKGWVRECQMVEEGYAEYLKGKEEADEKLAQEG